jgi:chromosome segregation and condensation protein ScpB
MDKSEFAKDFSEFYSEVQKAGVEITIGDVATLYAIYRKDLRTGRINDKEIEMESNEGQPATEKQKQFLMDLAYKKGLCITQTELDRMTREQASKTIDTLLEGD